MIIRIIRHILSAPLPIHYQEVLHEAAQELGVQIGVICQKPHARSDDIS